ncbi:hypothetical protein B0H66DRAFT_562305 [Apodospora peruviana]|uniref:Uncharacterized protein n=1 Tax=Apodospora peruviana TaxID=516989 RepID=A0AAE0I1H8_9PEZI|nr:hypothetical protein B0H66DRAFT_562305 [Apodospora peruviana]
MPHERPPLPVHGAHEDCNHYKFRDDGLMYLYDPANPALEDLYLIDRNNIKLRRGQPIKFPGGLYLHCVDGEGGVYVEVDCSWCQEGQQRWDLGIRWNRAHVVDFAHWLHTRWQARWVMLKTRAANNGEPEPRIPPRTRVLAYVAPGTWDTEAMTVL